jgi:hypothetical protein
MIEIGRRGFITGLIALVAAPAIVRVETLMPISVRHTPLYVPASWLHQSIHNGERWIADLESHAWTEPLADNWINLHDYDPAFAAKWAKTDLVDQNPEYWLS